jgi:large subunit ribosomal protein L5
VAARLKEQYNSEIIATMREKFSYGNVMQVPQLEKIVVNMGVGDATQDPRMMDTAMSELMAITGQKPAPRKARHRLHGDAARRADVRIS